MGPRAGLVTQAGGKILSPLPGIEPVIQSDILISAGMKFRNKKKFRYGIPAYTGPFRALGEGAVRTKMAYIIMTLTFAF
jgi:hypothetical protein